MKKLKLVFYVLAFVLVASVMGFGIYASTISSYKINSRLSFTQTQNLDLVLSAGVYRAQSETSMLFNGAWQDIWLLDGANTTMTKQVNSNPSNTEFADWEMPDYAFKTEEGYRIFVIELNFKNLDTNYYFDVNVTIPTIASSSSAYSALGISCYSFDIISSQYSEATEITKNGTSSVYSLRVPKSGNKVFRIAYKLLKVQRFEFSNNVNVALVEQTRS